jgi:hypothetical protein
MITLDFTPAEREAFIKDARRELVEKLYNELASDIQTISKARMAGLLDVDGKTLETMGVPRVPCTTKLIKYRLSSVAKWLADHEEK